MAPTEETRNLTKLVLENLEFQHDWTELQVHSTPNLPRDVIFGLPPRRLYIHPDEQIEIIKAEKNRDEPMPQPPELEWVLPLHLSEKWTVQRFAAVFDGLEAVPPESSTTKVAEESHEQEARWKQWRGPKRGKRVLLATVQDDSTIVYYLMHDGIVKPRQN
ncbi:hypothetical protein GQ53DRAFT_669248 [Thozetella sp. PMI_491]|nr:hypothetical protein GQ53DRAFT_669248 [Thozetella sp. PMI_491]